MKIIKKWQRDRFLCFGIDAECNLYINVADSLSNMSDHEYNRFWYSWNKNGWTLSFKDICLIGKHFGHLVNFS